MERNEGRGPHASIQSNRVGVSVHHSSADWASARAQSETSARSAEVKVYDKNNELVYSTFTVQDAPASVEGQDFGYGDHTGWD